MNKKHKHITLEYQTIQDITVILLYIFILFIIITSYRDQILNFQLKSIVTPEEGAIIILLYGMLASLIIVISYYLTKILVQLFYTSARYEHWYGSLIERKVSFGLTKDQFDLVKDNKMFLDVYNDRDIKPCHSYFKFDKWVEKIIGDEINKLSKNRRR